MRPAPTAQPLILVLSLALSLSLASPALGCFGLRLKVGLPSNPTLALAAYTLGYYVEDHAAMEPAFVPTDDPAGALADNKIDVAVVASSVTVPAGVVVRPAGDLPQMGTARVWIRPGVLDDLRFTLVDRVLKKLPRVLTLPGFEAAIAADNPRRAARKLVLDAP